jgi:hypothetical protein
VSFDALAPGIEDGACLGEIAAPHRVLIVGEGKGRFLGELVRLPRNGMARLSTDGWLVAMYLFFRITTRIQARKRLDLMPFMRADRFLRCHPKARRR